MINHKAIIGITAVFCIYMWLAYGLPFLLNLSIPVWIEHAIGLFCQPASWLTAPWMGLLTRLHLTEGEWIRMPNFFGYLLVVFLYTGGLYGLLWTAGSTGRLPFLRK